MTTRTVPDPADRLDRPIVLEFAVVVGLIVLTYLWQHLLTEAWMAYGDALPLASDAAALGVSGLVYLAGIGGIAAAYVWLRDVEVALGLPALGQLPVVALAVVAPAVLVGLTALAGTYTDVPFGDLTASSYGSVPSRQLLGLLVVVGPILGAATYSLLCQVLVQGTFARTVEGPVASLLTALVTGFLLVQTSGGLTTRPDRGHLLAAAIFAVALGLGVAATERVERSWMRALAFVPAAGIVGLAVLEAVAAIGTVAGGLFVATNVAVLGLAAVAYDRTESLLVPALSYLSLLVAVQVVLLAVQTDFPTV